MTFCCYFFKYVQWLFMKNGVCCCRSQDSCLFFRMLDLVGNRTDFSVLLCRTIDVKDVKSASIFMPPPFEEWWRGIKCYPWPCVRACVRESVRPSEICCPLNNFWKTASIQFKFGMLIYNFKTQVEVNLGYNPLFFTELWVFYKNIVQKLVSAQ